MAVPSPQNQYLLSNERPTSPARPPIHPSTSTYSSTQTSSPSFAPAPPPEVLPTIVPTGTDAPADPPATHQHQTPLDTFLSALIAVAPPPRFDWTPLGSSLGPAERVRAFASASAPWKPWLRRGSYEVPAATSLKTTLFKNWGQCFWNYAFCGFLFFLGAGVVHSKSLMLVLAVAALGFAIFCVWTDDWKIGEFVVGDTMKRVLFSAVCVAASFCGRVLKLFTWTVVFAFGFSVAHGVFYVGERAGEEMEEEAI